MKDYTIKFKCGYGCDQIYSCKVNEMTVVRCLHNGEGKKLAEWYPVQIIGVSINKKEKKKKEIIHQARKDIHKSLKKIKKKTNLITKSIFFNV